VQSAVRATTDDQFLTLWLQLKQSAHTRRACERNVGLLQAFMAEKDIAGLRGIKIDDLYEFLNGRQFAANSIRTHAARLACMKSLFKFGVTSGYLPFNIAAPIPSSKVQNDKAERLLSEHDVFKLIEAAGRARQNNAEKFRNKVLAKFLYYSGARMSEASELIWECTKDRDDGQMQITIHGKGGKTRHVLLPKFADGLRNLRGDAQDPDPVFRSQKANSTSGIHPFALGTKAIKQIISMAASRARIRKPVTPHWLRHAHITHSLDRGASMATVRETVGHSNLSVTSIYSHAQPDDSSGLYLPKAR
jgi:integrase/recombinase XerD